MNRLLLLPLLSVLACGGGTKGPFIAGFNPSPVQQGYTRFVTPVIHGIQPGDNKMWCQWIQAPLDHDVDVVSMTGEQSKYGHHVILYASTVTSPLGTTRECTSADMESVRYLGGFGGDGSTMQMPQGIVLRLPAGEALMINIHFIDASYSPIEGQAVVDVKFADPNPQDQVAGFFANMASEFDVPPHQAGTADATCVVQRDMNFFAFGDHMHALGTSMYSEVLPQTGAKTTLASETIWQAEFEFNPKVSTWPTTSPTVVKTGDTIHSHCEWNNITDSPAAFPVEMCVGFGFYLPGGNPDEICTDGSW